ncbi:hypothetical protein MRX96_023587 [Rhipicephalus microplus]
MGSAYDHWDNVVGSAENVEPDAPPLAVDSKQLPKKRARRRGFRVRGGDARGGNDKPQGTDHRRHIHGMHYFSFARFASRHNDAERVESISSAAHLQNERGGTMEAPLLSALFLLTSLLFLVSLLSLYYFIAFSHLGPVRENQSTGVALVLTALLRNFAAPYVVTLSIGESVMNSEAMSVSELYGGTADDLQSPTIRYSTLLLEERERRPHTSTARREDLKKCRRVKSVGGRRAGDTEARLVSIRAGGVSRAFQPRLEAPELLLGPTSWQLTLATETVQDVHKHRWAYERYALAILCDVLPGVASGGALSKLATDLYVFEQANIHFAQALWSGILRDVFDNLELSTLQLVPTSCSSVVTTWRSSTTYCEEGSVVLVNYLGWRMVEYIAWSCSANLRDHRRRFRAAVRPFKLAADSLEVQCAMEVHQLLPASSSRLYRFAVSLLPKNERVVNHIGMPPVYEPVKNTLVVPYGMLVIPLFTDAIPAILSRGRLQELLMVVLIHSNELRSKQAMHGVSS